MKHKHLIFLIAFALLPVFVMASGQSECTQNDNFGRFNTKPIFKRTFLNQSVTRTTNKITRKPISSVHNRNMNEDIVITYEDFLEHLSPDKERLLQYYIHTIPMDVKGVDTTAAPTQSWVWDMPNLDNAQSNYSILQLSSEESEEFLDLYPTLTHVGYGVPNDAFGFYELTDNSQNEGFLTLLGELDFFGEDFYQLDYDLVAAPVPAELGWVVEGVITYIFEEESNIDTIRLLPALDTLVIDELLDSIKFVQDLEIVACGTLNTYDDGSVPALKIHNHETYLAYRNDTIIDSGVLGRQVWWYSEEGHFIRARLKDDQPFSGSTIFQSMLYQKLVDAPLPIAWTDFTAKVNNRKQVELTWQTTTEQDNSHFIIQKSTDGKTFIKIGEQAGKGNSTAMQTYNFKDKEPTIGTNYYRIQQIDNDGKSTFSEVITAIILDDSETNPTVVLYPNPGKNEVWFSQPADYELFDSKGQLLTSGQADGVVDVSGLAAGTYFVRINGGAMQSWLKN